MNHSKVPPKKKMYKLKCTAQHIVVTFHFHHSLNSNSKLAYYSSVPSCILIHTHTHATALSLVFHLKIQWTYGAITMTINIENKLYKKCTRENVFICCSSKIGNKTSVYQQNQYNLPSNARRSFGLSCL